MYDFTTTQSITDRINAETAEYLAANPDITGFDRLGARSQIAKQYQKEMDAAKNQLYAQSPGGTYQSFIASGGGVASMFARNPDDKANWARAYRQGYTTSKMRELGYTGPDIDPNKFFPVQYGITGRPRGKNLERMQRSGMFPMLGEYQGGTDVSGGLGGYGGGVGVGGQGEKLTNVPGNRGKQSGSSSYRNSGGTVKNQSVNVS